MSETPVPARLSRAVRAYRRASPAFRRLQRIQHAVFTGVFIGVMDRGSFAQLDESYYDAHREPLGTQRLAYVDPDHIASGLADWEAAALERHFPNGGSVVVTGAGAGREVLGAAEMGFDAVGYEPHEGLVTAGSEVLRNSGLPARLMHSARDEFPHRGRVDGVIVGWGSFSHIAGRARRRAFLAGARSVLGEGAPLLVSYWPRDETERYYSIVAGVSRPLRRLRGDEEAEVGDILAPLFVHCFTEAEVVAELGAAGLECVEMRASPYPHGVFRAA